MLFSTQVQNEFNNFDWKTTALNTVGQQSCAREARWRAAREWEDISRDWIESSSVRRRLYCFTMYQRGRKRKRLGRKWILKKLKSSGIQSHWKLLQNTSFDGYRDSSSHYACSHWTRRNDSQADEIACCTLAIYNRFHSRRRSCWRMEREKNERGSINLITSPPNVFLSLLQRFI